MINLLAQTTYYSNGSNGLGYVSLALSLAVLGLGIYAAIDANKYDDTVWTQAGQNKILWIVLVTVIPLLFFCCCFLIGAIPIGIYFLLIKKKLDEAQRSGGAYGVSVRCSVSGLYWSAITRRTAPLSGSITAMSRCCSPTPTTRRSRPRPAPCRPTPR